MAGFKTRFNQLTPDFRQVIFLRAEQTDTLRTGNFGVQVKFTRDTAHGHQAFRGNFATRRARDHGVSTVFLDVSQEVVVGVLQRRVLWFEDVLIPAGSQQGTHGRFTHFAAVAFPVFGQQLFEGFDAFYTDEMEQFLT